MRLVFKILCALLLNVNNDAALANSQSTKGCGSAALNNVSGGYISYSIACNIITGGRKMTALEKNKNILLLSQNLPEFHISSVSINGWVEDRLNNSLNITLENSKNTPISSITVDVLDPGTGSAYDNLLPLKLEKSVIYRTIGANSIALAANSKTIIPIGFVAEIGSKVNKIPENYCAFDASKDSITNAERSDSENALSELSTIRYQDSTHDNIIGHKFSKYSIQGVLLRLKYESIFGQKFTSYAWIFIRYASRDSKYVWYPSENRYGLLKCVE